MDAFNAATRALTASSTSDGFSPFRINTMPDDDFVLVVLADEALTRHGADFTSAISRISSGVPLCSATTMSPMSSRGAEHADAANQILLLALLHETAAGVRVAAAERGETCCSVTL